MTVTTREALIRRIQNHKDLAKIQFESIQADSILDEEILVEYIITCAFYGICGLKKVLHGKSITQCFKDAKISHGQFARLVYSFHDTLRARFPDRQIVYPDDKIIERIKKNPVIALKEVNQSTVTTASESNTSAQQPSTETNSQTEQAQPGSQDQTVNAESSSTNAETSTVSETTSQSQS